LRARGIVLLGAGEPIVLCAVDWIGIANEGQDVFRQALAEAAGTTPQRAGCLTPATALGTASAPRFEPARVRFAVAA